MLNCILLFFHKAQTKEMLKSPLRVYVSMFSSAVVWSTPRTVTDCTHSAQWQWAPAVIALQHSCKPTAEGRGLLGRWARLVLFSSWHAVKSLQKRWLPCREPESVAFQVAWATSFKDVVVFVEDWAPCCHSLLALQWPHFRFAAHKRGALWFMSLHENSIIALKLRCELCHKS